MFISNRHVVAIALFGASLFAQFEARATHVRIVSGLSGGQDSKSKELLALSPAATNQAATRDLLSVLRPSGKFTLDNSRNVEGMTFITPPYQTAYRYVCREDRVTLQYALEDRFDAKGTWLENQRQPVGVEAEQTYHVDELPVPGFVPGSSYPTTVCDSHHPDATATWFTATGAATAVRAVNMFRMAEDEVKAGRLKPGPCDLHGADSCPEWVRSLDDVSKIKSVEPCAAEQDQACYIISFDAVDMTVTGTIPRTELPPQVTPTAITSVRVDSVLTLSE
jgi:hypothetical protein